MSQNGLEILTAAMVDNILHGDLGTRQKILKVKDESQIWSTGYSTHADAAEKLGIDVSKVGFPGIVSPDGRQETKKGFQGILLTRSGGSFQERPFITEAEQTAVIDMLTLMLSEIGRTGVVRLDEISL